MKYVVNVDGREIAVEIVGETVRVDGRPVAASMTAIPGTPVRRLVRDGRNRPVVMSRNGDGWTVLAGGRRWEIGIEDERTHQIRRMAGGAPGGGAPGIVRAPMPGLVLRVEVEDGQPVQRGHGLIVLEAMKMENELRAAADGMVTRIYVTPGAAVEKGDPLLEIGAAG